MSKLFLFLAEETSSKPVRKFEIIDVCVQINKQDWIIIGSFGIMMCDKMVCQWCVGCLYMR